MKRLFILITILFLSFSCAKDNDTPKEQLPLENSKELTIFHFNDQHGRIENFAKIRHIIDQERELTNVMVVCGGDIFSGNPVVDNHEEKGYPMIDLMNKIGVDVSVLGNHEFDYGEEILSNRFEQAEFDWVCANVNTRASEIPQPKAYKTISKKDIKVTFLGLVETNGKDNDVIPSTHPWRVENLTFEKYNNVVDQYSVIKEQENSDLYVALTHLGNSSDHNLANSFPYFDLIIGGHSHSKNNEVVNEIPIFQAGSNLNYLGKIKLTIQNKKIESINYELIDLEKYANFDNSIKEVVETYIENSNLSEVIGFAEVYHSKSTVGSFYTDALRNEMNVDVTFQNTGGVRKDLNKGDILKSEIYSIDPFNNGSVTYTMTVGEIKDFLKGSKVGIYYAGLEIEQENGVITLLKNGKELNNTIALKVGLNDYIPAVYDTYFTQTPTITPYTTAETIINYLENNAAPINYSQVNKYFKFQ